MWGFLVSIPLISILNIDISYVYFSVYFLPLITYITDYVNVRLIVCKLYFARPPIRSEENKNIVKTS